MRKLTADMMAYLLNGAEPGLDPLQPSRRIFPSGVLRHRNVTYSAGEKRAAVRHLLDLYLPAEEQWLTARPLLIFVHGGGWRIGSKDDLSGLYGRIAHEFAERGIAFAIVNYRLSPRVKHPAHVEDVATALTFLKTAADTYGYAAENAFLMGHSAGAQIAALLALNPRFLMAQTLQTTTVSGVIALSGLYDLRGLAAFIPAELDELRTVRTTPDHPLARAGIAFAPSDYADASPILQVTGKAPPFLLFHEEFGPAMVDETKRFAAVLAENALDYKIIEMVGTNHISMLVELARQPGIGIVPIIEFVTAHC